MHLIYRTFLVIFSVFLLSTSTFAQKNILKPAKISAGIKGGYFSTSIGFLPAISTLPETSPSFGVVMKYHAEKYFGAQLEVNYNAIGWTEVNRFDVTQEIYNRKFEYIQVPFLTHIYIGKKNLQFFITLGPQMDILIGESKKIITDLDDQSYDYYEKPVNPFTLSIAGGGGLNLITKIGHFQVEGRFAASMMNVLENERRTSTEGSTSVLGGVTFSYLIPISGWKEKPKNNESGQSIEQPDESGWERRD
ncbi:porin family protein [Flammeovirga sp. EKP202]|uniref:porin family protein n=1 Tax=Flammeovirga sp. EKP202 TaxID=2770592 RepID=UPI00165FE850|nr:porin family protein [Flammeovirga sp. EKP202]MBD0401893.1 PorT family protein [Flammeovirga sp. EKP202]